MSTQKEIRNIEVVANGKKAEATMNEITAAIKVMRNEIGKLPADSAKAKHLRDEMAKLNTRFRDLNQEMRGVSKSTSSFWATMKGGMIGVLGGNLLTNLLGTLNNITFGVLNNTAKVSDQLADLGRVTGMTTTEVEELNSQLKKIDTRTSFTALREMAVVAGQLGISKDNIKGFVESIDKINLVMGSEFGGDAEKVASEIGRLRNVFTDIKSADIGADMLHIGNAMNELAQAGFATAPVMADFAARIGGVGISLGLTTGQVLGLSATLQELNVSTERGGTAVTRILQYMSKKTDVFAKVAGMNVKEFTTLVNKDMYGAFMKVVEGAGKSASKATELALTLDQLGVDGAGASEVIAKLSKNQGMLTEKVNMANTSITEQDGILTQADKKNNNLAANLEKLGKKMASVWESSIVKNALNELVLLFGSTATEADNLISKFQQQETMVKKLEQSISPLLTRYDQLKEKTTLNKDEQAELKKIINQVGAAIPGAVTAFDKYGNALDINAGKARQFIKDQALALKSMNRDAITSLQDQIKKTNTLMKGEQDLLEYYRAVGYKNLKGKDDAEKERNLNKYLSERISIISRLNAQIAEDQARLRQLKGEDLIAAAELMDKEAADRKKQQDDKKNDYVAETEAEEKARKKREALAEKERKKNARDLEKEAKEHTQMIENEYDKTLEYIRAWHNIEETVVKNKYLNGEIDYNTYQQQLFDINLRYLEAQKIAHLDYSKDDSDINKQIVDERIKQMERQKKKAEELQKDAPSDFILGNTGKVSTEKEKSKEEWDTYATATLNAYNQFIDLEKARENAALAADKVILNSRLASLDKQLAAGRLTEKKHATETAKIQAEYDAKRRQILTQQWKREQAASIGQAIINTAVGATKAFAQAGAAGFILGGLVSAAGALQIAAIANQPVPEFAHGGSTRVTGASGSSYNADYYGSSWAGGRLSNPGYIAGERGPELVIPPWLYTAPRMLNTMAMLESSISSRTLPASGTSTSTADPQLASVLARLANRLDEPFYGLAYFDKDKYDRRVNNETVVREMSRIS